MPILYLLDLYQGYHIEVVVMALVSVEAEYLSQMWFLGAIDIVYIDVVNGTHPMYRYA